MLTRTASWSKTSWTTIDHHTDEGAIAQADKGVGFDRIEKLPCLVSREDRRLAPFDDVLRPPDGCSRVHRKNLPRHEPVRGEFIKSSGNRRLVQPPTVLLPSDTKQSLSVTQVRQDLAGGLLTPRASCAH